MSLTLIIGPMFSGKSKTLIEIVRDTKKRKKNALVVAHASDTRYSKNNLATHDNDFEPCESRLDLIPLIAEITPDIVSICIEEAQFFDDLYPFVHECILRGKEVYVAGLQSDYRMESFSSIMSLIPIADRIMHLRARCMHDGCKNYASFSKCVNLESCLQNSIGGSDKYIATCRAHFLDQ